MNAFAPETFQNAVEPLMTDVQLEAFFGVARGWAAKDRVGKARIPFVHIGRYLRYRRADVLAFIEANVRKSTSDAGRVHRSALASDSERASSPGFLSAQISSGWS